MSSLAQVVPTRKLPQIAVGLFGLNVNATAGRPQRTHHAIWGLGITFRIHAVPPDGEARSQGVATEDQTVEIQLAVPQPILCGEREADGYVNGNDHRRAGNVRGGVGVRSGESGQAGF